MCIGLLYVLRQHLHLRQNCCSISVNSHLVCRCPGFRAQLSVNNSPVPRMANPGPARDQYDFQHSRRGIAIIINNMQFDGQKDMERKGTGTDLKSLWKAFEKLGFAEDQDIYLKPNLTKAGMKEAIENCMDDEDNANSDCFMCVIMTHGDFLPTNTEMRHCRVMTDVVCATDGPMDLKDLIEIVAKCEALKGKPKIFLIQACRGVLASQPVDVTHIETDQAESPSPGPNLSGTQPATIDATGLPPGLLGCVETNLPYEIPVFKDSLLIYATQPGYVSFRTTDKGTPFIQNFCKQVELHGNTLDFMSLLTRVNRDVAYEYEAYMPKSSLNEKKMMPWVASRLSKDVVFSVKR